MSWGRWAGYRLLGSRFDYLLHTRPLEWPIVAGHTAVGYLLAVGLPGAGQGASSEAAVLGIALWVVCLNGGTLALNSAFDRDEGDIAYLKRPPPAPPHLAAFGLGLMLAGLLIATLLPGPYLAAYAGCVILSVLYSVPPFRLKAVPGLDWLINMWGFGTLTPYAGWTATGQPIGRVGGLIFLGFCPLFAALYPLTQIYQIEEDLRRGDRTLAIALGPRVSLVIAMMAAIVAFSFLVAAGVLVRWSARENWRWLVLAIAAAGWAVVLLPWFFRLNRATAREHQRGMYRALFAWALTDLAVVLVWAT